MLTKSNDLLRKINNTCNYMPLLVEKSEVGKWFDSSSKEDLNLLKSPQLSCHSISKEFFDNNIIYNSVLEPKRYKALASNPAQDFSSN